MPCSVHKLLSHANYFTIKPCTIIRTSVDHGTAFGKAGKNRANEESLVDAINMAITFAENWDRQ